MVHKKDLISQYYEYSGLDELPEKHRELVNKAKLAIRSSYSPYSEFAVGAAVLLENGETVLGSNQENGAYPSGLCAERVALFYAGTAYPGVAVEAMAIAANFKGKPISSPVSPCGGCRQVMIETQNITKKPFTVLMIGETKILAVRDVKFLLPFSFSNINDAIQ